MKAENSAECNPPVPSLGCGPVDESEVDESIRQVSQQWAEALARLEHL